jgi:hypothetical protein
MNLPTSLPHSSFRSIPNHPIDFLLLGSALKVGGWEKFFEVTRMQ